MRRCTTQTKIVERRHGGVVDVESGTVSDVLVRNESDVDQRLAAGGSALGDHVQVAGLEAGATGHPVR